MIYIKTGHSASLKKQPTLESEDLLLKANINHLINWGLAFFSLFRNQNVFIKVFFKVWHRKIGSY